MKKAILVYNPVSGIGKMSYYLDSVVYELQKREILVIPLRTPVDESLLLALLYERVDYVLASGGDGTIHQVINTLANCPAPPPLGILPAGTSNDFAANFGLPELEQVLPALDFSRQCSVDAGKIGQQYFINVASGGLLTDVAHKVDQRLKNNLGKAAYYLQGLAELPNIRTFSAKVFADGRLVYSGELFLFIVLNGQSAGSFKYLAPSAELDDGLLDLLIFKRCTVPEFLNLVMRVFAGKHLRDPHLLYLQGKSFAIESSEEVPTDVDGEIGPPLPWQIEVARQKIRLLPCIAQE